MCEQRDAMRRVRDAAECLSAVCRARGSATLTVLSDLYHKTVDEPVPDAITETLRGLKSAGRRH